MQLNRKKLFAVIGNELDKMGIGNEFQIDHGKIIVEISILNGKVDTVVGVRQSTKSWDLRGELSQQT